MAREGVLYRAGRDLGSGKRMYQYVVLDGVHCVQGADGVAVEEDVSMFGCMYGSCVRLIEYERNGNGYISF